MMRWLDMNWLALLLFALSMIREQIGASLRHLKQRLRHRRKLEVGSTLAFAGSLDVVHLPSLVHRRSL
jgi:hypothetical protein